MKTIPSAEPAALRRTHGSVQNPIVLASRPTHSDERGRPWHRPILAPGRSSEVHRTPTIDFGELRRRVPIARVLELVTFRPLRRSGAEVRGPCPIHEAALPRSRSFAANLRKNVFHCFHCGAAGNALELYAAVHRTTIYRAAVELCERLQIELPQRKASFHPKPAATALRAARSDRTAGENTM